jgi:hypothetical protein
MRLWLLDRFRRSRWWRKSDQVEADQVRVRDRGDPVPGPGTGPAATPGAAGAHRRTGGGRPAAPRVGTDQPRAAAARPVPPASSANRASTASPGTSTQAGRTGRPGGHALPRRWGMARAATRAAPKADAAAEPARPPARAARRAAEARPPWYEIAQSNRTVVGRRHCGHLEPLVHREWAEDVVPSPEVVRAIDRLAELPQLIKSKLAAGLDAIYVGMGGVPNLDDMGRLAGVPLPSGRATWDACAGAYGERKIIVGSRPSPSPDVMCHEIGHALDDIDGIDDQWQSDSAEFQALYDQCLPHMVSAFHRQPGLLGRREFFADAFAAIASRQRPALVEMLGGDTRTALNVMLYFNVRYGI